MFTVQILADMIFIGEYMIDVPQRLFIVRTPTSIRQSVYSVENVSSITGRPSRDSRFQLMIIPFVWRYPKWFVLSKSMTRGKCLVASFIRFQSTFSISVSSRHQPGWMTGISHSSLANCSGHEGL